MLKFKNGHDMWKTVVEDEIDVYNVNSGEYIFRYNELCSVCTYYLSNEYALDLINECGEEYWGGLLGISGHITDSSDWYEEHEEERPEIDPVDGYFDDIYSTYGWYACDDDELKTYLERKIV